MKTYQGTAERDGRFWVVRVEGVGVTQGRSRSEALRQAAELVEIMNEVPLEEFEVHIEFRPTCE